MISIKETIQMKKQLFLATALFALVALLLVPGTAVASLNACFEACEEAYFQCLQEGICTPYHCGLNRNYCEARCGGYQP